MQNNLLCFLIVVGLLGGCANNDTNEPIPETINVSLNGYQGTVGWVQQSAQSQPKATIVAVHGTPGSWTAWRDLMDQPAAANYHIVAFDRPGWGSSLSETGQMVTSLADQAALLSDAIKKLELKEPVIAVGHSWGGPVVLALAAYHPELIDGLVLVAGPADAAVSEPRWYHRLANNGLISAIIGSTLRNSNAEMLALASELKKIEPDLYSIQQPTSIMQGKKDFLVSYENAFFLDQQLVNAPVHFVYDLNGNHFVPFQEPEKIVSEIEWVQSRIGTN